MSGFTQVDYWLAETVSDPFVVRRLLMGGSLTNLIAVWFLLCGRPACNISTYCWVLREHVSVCSDEDESGLSQPLNQSD